MSVKKFYNLAKNRLFPINRSITGNGIRKTLHLIKKQFPELKIIKFHQKLRFSIGLFQANGMLLMHMFL